MSPVDYSWTNLPQINQPAFKKNIVNIAKHGAISDGITLNTQIINSAIATCSKSGGGVVVIPAGLWLSGPVILKSGVNLHLKKGATLLFTRNDKYHRSPISAEDQQNIAITGKGIIETGEGFRHKINRDFLHPGLLVLINCRRILLEGVTLQNYPASGLHALCCEDLMVRKVIVKNQKYKQNGYGINIESCKNFLIEDCILDIRDAAIRIKPGKEDGCKGDRSVENGVIRNNRICNAHDGLVIDNEMNDCIRNIFVENCTFTGTQRGFRFKSERGCGGVVEKFYARNIFMKNILQEAVFFDMPVKFMADNKKNMKVAIGKEISVFKDMEFENIICNGAEKGLYMHGLPGMNVKNITVKNAVLKTRTGIELIGTSNIRLLNVKLITQHMEPVITMENSCDIFVDNLNYTSAADLLLSVSGEASNNIRFINTDACKAKKKVNFKNGALEAAVQIKDLPS